MSIWTKLVLFVAIASVPTLLDDGIRVAAEQKT